MTLAVSSFHPIIDSDLFYFFRRQKELEEKLIEEEVAKRVESLVAQRVEEELEKRKDEIEQEVLRRVEEAKRIMEKQMLEEMERQRQAEMEIQKKKEVKCDTNKSPRVIMVCQLTSWLWAQSSSSWESSLVECDPKISHKGQHKRFVFLLFSVLAAFETNTGRTWKDFTCY